MRGNEQVISLLALSWLLIAPLQSAGECLNGDCTQPGSRRQPKRYELEAFGSFAPTPTPLSASTPVPTAAPPAAPTSVSGTTSGGSEVATALLQLLGSATGLFSGQGILSGEGIFGGGNIFSGGGSYGTNDAFGGNRGAEKFFTSEDNASDYLANLQEQSPGTINRSEVCFPTTEDQIVGPGDEVIYAHSTDQGMGDGAGRSIAENTGANYKGYGDDQQFLDHIRNNAAGLTTKQTESGEEPVNTLVVVSCHGSKDGTFYMGFGQGVSYQEVDQAIAEGQAAASAAGREPGKISYAAGCCYPHEPKSADHYLTGANPNQPNYFNPSTGSLNVEGHLYGASGDGFITLDEWLSIHPKMNPRGNGSVRKTGGSRRGARKGEQLR